MRSVEFHPEAQDEFISAAQFYERQADGLGLDFILTAQHTYERLPSFLPLALRSAGGSGVFWCPSFPTVSCIASSLSASISSLSCIFTADQPTGGPASET